MERKTKSSTVKTYLGSKIKGRRPGSKIKGRRPLHSDDTKGPSPNLHDIERRPSPNTCRQNIGETSSQESFDDQEDDTNKDDASKIKNSCNKCIPDKSQPLCDYEPESFAQNMVPQANMMPQSAPHSAGLVKTYTSNKYKIAIVILAVAITSGFSYSGYHNRGYDDDDDVVDDADNSLSTFDYDDSINMIHHGRRNYRELSLKERLLKRDLLKIQKKFTSQRKSTWPDLFGGIKKVLNVPHSPSVFVLLHNGENDRRTVDCLSYEVARAASAYVTAKQNNFPVLDGRNLTTVLKNKDIGKFVHFLRECVNQTQVVVVNHLEALDGKIAQSFHHFCDEVVPFVKEAVYFFTLTIPPTRGIRPVEAAEDRLNSLWRNQIDPDILQALVIRLTSSVISILPEPDDSDCFIDERHKLRFNSFSDRMRYN